MSLFVVEDKAASFSCYLLLGWCDVKSTLFAVGLIWEERRKKRDAKKEIAFKKGAVAAVKNWTHVTEYNRHDM